MDYLETNWLGRVPYLGGLALQKTAVNARNDDPALPDTLFLLEHPPTYTLGVRGNRENLLVDEALLVQQGVTVHHVKRGGDVTFHGPGQLVGYPIFNMKRANVRLGKRPLDVRAFVQNIEACIIQTLDTFDVEGWRDERYPGVWVDLNGTQAKIAAIGIHVNRNRITSHGFALNIDPDMDYFDQIIPCGIQEYRATSLAEVLKRPLSVETVLPIITNAFYEVFQFEEHGVSCSLSM